MFVNPLENIIPRGDDPTGHGYYGASRGARKHHGLDILCKKEEKVFSPIEGKVSKIGYPYAGDLKYRYIEIRNSEYKIWIMYATSIVEVGDRIDKKQIIGYTQDVSEKWKGGMKPHIHVQVWKHGLLTDPEPLFNWS